jgi:hypothetical protein
MHHRYGEHDKEEKTEFDEAIDFHSTVSLGYHNIVIHGFQVLP